MRRDRGGVRRSKRCDRGAGPGAKVQRRNSLRGSEPTERPCTQRRWRTNTRTGLPAQEKSKWKTLRTSLANARGACASGCAGKEGAQHKLDTCTPGRAASAFYNLPESVKDTDPFGNAAFVQTVDVWQGFVRDEDDDKPEVDWFALVIVSFVARPQHQPAGF